MSKSLLVQLPPPGALPALRLVLGCTSPATQGDSPCLGIHGHISLEVADTKQSRKKDHPEQACGGGGPHGQICKQVLSQGDRSVRRSERRSDSTNNQGPVQRGLLVKIMGFRLS